MLGSNGMIGHAVSRVLLEDCNLHMFSRHPQVLPVKFWNSGHIYSPNLNLSVEENVGELISRINPAYVINCIGITKQKIHNYELSLVININSDFPKFLSNLALKKNFKLIHLSTDCVYDGKKGSPYLETDDPNATDLYGQTKAEGDNCINENVSVLRKSTIGFELGLDDQKHGLLEWFMSVDKRCKGYSNAIFSGITNIELAEFIADCLHKDKFRSGLYNVSIDPISKFELLNLLNAYIRSDDQVEILEDPSFKVDRSLDNSKFNLNFNYKLKNWAAMLNNLKSDIEN